MDIENAAPAVQPRFAEIGETTDTYRAPLGQQAADKEPEAPEAAKSPREAVERALAKATPADDPKTGIRRPSRLAPPAPQDEDRSARPTHPEAVKPSDPETAKLTRPGGAMPPDPEVRAERASKDAPRRFHDIARQEWSNTPESVRAEVNRSLAELESGLAKYRQSHEKYESLREYDELATRSGTTIKDALANYSGIERLLHQDPLAALERIVANVAAHKQWRNPDGSPVGFRDLAAHYLNMPADRAASRQDAVIRQMSEQITSLTNRSAAFEKAMQENRRRDTVALVQDFASDHPRVEELADDIALLLESGRAADLRNAYELAYRMNNLSSQPLIQAQTLDAAQTRNQRPANMAGQKSVSGAPSAGSDPRTGKPSKTRREALLKAFRKVQ